MEKIQSYEEWLERMIQYYESKQDKIDAGFGDGVISGLAFGYDAQIKSELDTSTAKISQIEKMIQVDFYGHESMACHY